MKISVRHQAVEILNQINTSRAFASPLINDCLDKNNLSGTADGRLLTHLVYGVLRFRGHLDWLLAKLYRGSFEKLDDGIKNILRLSLYQLKFSDRLPDFAVVNEAVEIAKIIKPDKSALVNAVLRNYLRRGKSLTFPSPKKNEAEYIAVFHSHPLWLVKKWMGIFGVEETKSLCAANNQLPPLSLRVNTLKVSRNNLMEKLTSAGFEAEETKYSPDGIILNSSVQPIQKTEFYEAGFLRIQDEGAQLISFLLSANDKQSILDACAGAGGKATHLAAILQNKGSIVAVDRDEGKIDELKQESQRLEIKIITAKTLDFNLVLPEELRGKFDWVLVDAPCSGTGTLRRNPEIKWRTSEKDVTVFAAAQKTILQNASAAVKKGGFLLYCTCSLLPEENEKIVDDFLERNPYFSLIHPPVSINRAFIDNRGFFHSYPHRHSMDGFFGAILRYQF